MLVTNYDSTKLETVQAYFPKSQQPKAYTYIRDHEIEHEATYRKASKTRGRGSKLYPVDTLQEIKTTLNKASQEVLTALPDGCMDLAGISERYGIESHRISAGFALVGLEPRTTYRRGKAGRPVNAYNLKAVEYVISGLHELRQGLDNFHEEC